MTGPAGGGGPVAGLAGVVLCGGQSLRMGRDKALIEMGGRPLVAVLSDRLASVADPVLVAPGRPGRYAGLPGPAVLEVADEEEDAGPLGGLVAALAASPHPLLAVVAVDLPFASVAVLRLLASRCQGHDVAVPVTGRGREPLHAVWSTAALPAARLALAEGRPGLLALLDRLRVRDVGEDEWRAADPESRFAWNLNSPEDLAQLPPYGGSA